MSSVGELPMMQIILEVRQAGRRQAERCTIAAGLPLCLDDCLHLPPRCMSELMCNKSLLERDHASVHML